MGWDYIIHKQSLAAARRGSHVRTRAGNEGRMGAEASTMNVLSVTDPGADGLRTIVARSLAFKRGDVPVPQILAGRAVGMLFERPSLRTRASFEVATQRLGGHPTSLMDSEVGLGKREAISDVAQVLGRYFHIITARLRSHADLHTLATACPVPVINALTDEEHPCQVMAALMTIAEQTGRFEGRRVVFIGDGNNVCRSWHRAAPLCDIEFVHVAPSGFECAGFPRTDHVDAVEGADIIYTDTWASMGMEHERDDRSAAFLPFQVNERLLAQAPTAWVMHCLPAHRGEEITDAVIDGPRSLVMDEAENRMWVQMGLIEWLMASSGA
jgi:ornithine carbamoyltransferase